MKLVDDKELMQFHFEIEKAEQVLNQKDEKLEAIYSKMESNLTLIGATAVEDRLQDSVPEVIHDM